MTFHNPPKNCPVCKEICNSVFVMDHQNEYGQFSLYQCSICNVQFWIPFKAPPADWYEKHELYLFRSLRFPKIKRVYHKKFLEEFRDFLNPGKKVLDLGCGTGEFLNALQKLGCETWGVDLDKRAIGRAKTYFNLKNLYAMGLEEFFALSDLPKFDIITLFEVIEHIQNPKEVISGIKNILKRKGLLVLSTPSRNRVLVNATEMDFPYHHLSRWDETAIRNLLENNGFVINGIYHIERFISIYYTIYELLSSRVRFNFVRRARNLFIIKSSRQGDKQKVSSGILFMTYLVMGIRFFVQIVIRIPSFIISVTLFLIDTIKTGGRGVMLIISTRKEN